MELKITELEKLKFLDFSKTYTLSRIPINDLDFSSENQEYLDNIICKLNQEDFLQVEYKSFNSKYKGLIYTILDEYYSDFYCYQKTIFGSELLILYNGERVYRIRMKNTNIINLTDRNYNIKDYIFDLEYITDINEFKNKYVVIDTETNGLQSKEHDLLSLSIFDPTTGKCYNRFLPLDLQIAVHTTDINGITEENLKNSTHITQEELNEIIEYFDLKNKIILYYSAINKPFDYNFIINYCKRHKISGFENLKYENIKELLQSYKKTNGEMTKDNLCEAFNIQGIDTTHSSMNDCLLEWKLFEKIKNNNLVLLNKKIFKYNKGYIVPVSYLDNLDLLNYANIKTPNISAYTEVIYSLSFPKNILKSIKKFNLSNTTGIALENGISSYLGSVKQDNIDFIKNNNANLKYIGSLSKTNEPLIEIKEDGSCGLRDNLSEQIKAAFNFYMQMSFGVSPEQFCNDVNNVTKIILENMKDCLYFIKENIFKNKLIMNQELVVSKDKKVMAICDLSNNESILEIKTYDVLINGELDKKIARQLYYECKNREIYLLSVNIKEHKDKRFRYGNYADSVDVKIYKVILTKLDDDTKK